MTEPGQGRREQIAAGLRRVHARIEAALDGADRPAGAVRLVVVTKTFPVSDLRLLADLGQHDVGENRHQEAVEKHRQCTDLSLVWHFVGAVQTNKAAAVAGYADLVHSVDRLRLVRALGRGAHRAGRTLPCLVQVSLDPPAVRAGPTGARSGAEPHRAPQIADAVAGEPGLHLAGVMGIAPLGGEPEAAFARLAEVAEAVRARHPLAGVVSAGMSGDLEAAIRCGATHVRVGSAVLGDRPPLR